MTKIKDIKKGDVIYPPAREVRLWMRRWIEEKGLSESALHLTVKEIRETYPDKKGTWLLVTTERNAEWNGSQAPSDFRFKARPETNWKTA